MSLIDSAVISRAAPLTTTSLQLHSGNYRLLGANGLDPGGVQWDRKLVSSPWVHGEYPAHQKKRNSRGVVKVRITAGSQAALRAAQAELLDAFYQFQYTLTVVINSQSYAWTCFAADATIGMTDERWMNLNVEATFMFDRLPTPVQGPI